MHLSEKKDFAITIAIHLISTVFLPLPWLEGVGGEGELSEISIYFHPHPDPPHQGGGKNGFPFVALIAQQTTRVCPAHHLNKLTASPEARPAGLMEAAPSGWG